MSLQVCETILGDSQDQNYSQNNIRICIFFHSHSPTVYGGGFQRLNDLHYYCNKLNLEADKRIHLIKSDIKEIFKNSKQC